MKICTLASGSSGNCLYVETEHSKILVDAGISNKQITKRLGSIDVDIKDIDAVVVSHEHTDHALALPYLKAPVYVSSSVTGLWNDKVYDLRRFETGSVFSVNDTTITSFPVPHDAVDPVGFTLHDGTCKLGVVTDIGVSTKLISERLKGCNLLVVEFNHDENMMLYSPYPWHLKQRIKSRLGHLSNTEASNLLSTVANSGLHSVVLAHLSKVNNKAESALEFAYNALSKLGLGDVNINIAPRNNISEVIEI
ncbi:MAG: MBL fold metallo-hydrolase [Candidatus Dadabacteria bacterium]|nr:MBL fold metallo-hydrolase [Candidatus Dadabacteria bacterium]NIS07619.1 MBL fold metallo-hydrolase [Candidatus Dadabacteria bacterium]NIV42073.1 MBL fold metallo-hydrolase [Candidatus Dadabacteria bacterium]NIX16478.1 MBL fold metallo-hydrolase [Candidatus Dadabacteria bacterium]NIY21257.1 MBL fold metallo-hydrolase [Candidatus Dadabacteria bacterium]